MVAQIVKNFPNFCGAFCHYILCKASQINSRLLYSLTNLGFIIILSCMYIPVSQKYIFLSCLQITVLCALILSPSSRLCKEN
jgi:hypothetical protein